jgi:hypothetical protein
LNVQSIGQLLRRIVAQQMRILEQKIGDPPFDRGHLIALGADFQQRRHDY